MTTLTPENVEDGAGKAELRRRAELVASGNYSAFTVEEVNAEVRRTVEEARASWRMKVRERSNGGDTPCQF